MNATSPTQTSSRLELVDPAIAASWLEGHNNRPLRPSWVEGLRLIIAEGKWEPELGSIMFDSNGELINGQHRLNAIIKAGATVMVRVVRGLAPSVKMRLDEHEPRSTRDSLAIAGHNHTVARVALVASCARQCFSFPKIPRGAQDVVDFFSHWPHGEELLMVLRSAPRGVSRAGVTLALWGHGLSSLPAALNVAHALRTGECSGSILMLRERLLRRVGTGGGTTIQWEDFVLTTTAMVQHVAGGAPKRLQPSEPAGYKLRDQIRKAVAPKLAWKITREEPNS